MSSQFTVAIVGGGLLGRLLTISLFCAGWEVNLFEKGATSGRGSCAHTAAAMLAPISELVSSDSDVCWLGLESLPLWPQIIRRLPGEIFHCRKGTLIVAHESNRAELGRFSQVLAQKLRAAQLQASVVELCGDALAETEPSLSNAFKHGLLLPQEGCLDNRALLNAQLQFMKENDIGASFETEVTAVQPYAITVNGRVKQFDMVIDARGLGAKRELPLRGIRGETILVNAPEVNLTRPVRLLHPRFPLYVVPRPHHRYLIGATSFESDDMSPMTVQSALELLSALYTLDVGFSGATILEMETNCRPALFNNAPRVFVQPGLIRVNGLYRHGFTISPKIVSEVETYLTQGEFSPRFQTCFVEKSLCA